MAEALEKILKDEPDLDKDRQFIVWSSAHAPNKFDSGPWGVLYDFVGSGNIFLLADALRYGYVIDEPIRVEITTEQQEKIRAYYAVRNHNSDNLMHFCDGFRSALGLVGIKIPGVND